MVDVDATIDNEHVNIFTAGRSVLVESEGSKAEPPAVGDMRKTLTHEHQQPIMRPGWIRGTYHGVKR